MHTEDGLWNSMDGNGAKWHHTLEMDMAYYVWKRSQMASYNGIGHGILWLEMEPNGITGNAQRKIDLHNMKLQIGLHNIFRRTCDFSLLSSRLHQ